MIYKTLRVDANFSTNEAVKFIAETVNCSHLLNGDEGLYVPDENRWLEPETPLSEYDTLQDVEHIEFTSVAAKEADKKKKKNDAHGGGGGGGGGCCFQ